MNYSSPDLSLHPPRSPRVRLGGYVWLARLVDKARAAHADRLGSWLWANPLDLIFLKFLGLEGDAFKAAVGPLQSDTEALAWVQTHATTRTPWDIAAWSRWFENLAPISNERRERLSLRVGQSAAENREDISTWFHYIDVDDYFTFGGLPTAGAEPPSRPPGAIHYMAPDLTIHAPRSARVRLGGYVILARMLDKCRAQLLSKNGDYHYGCPLDLRWCEFTSIAPPALQAQVAKHRSDGELLTWIQSQTTRAPYEIELWSADREAAVPSDNESRDYVSKIVESDRAAHREDISTWFDMLDLDDYVSYGGVA